MTATDPPRPPLSTGKIVQTWWPLAASWLLMAAELPALSAIVARLSEPEINLAAYGGLVFPICLIIEAPIIMLLAASTALSKDWDSYVKLRRFMMRAGAILTAVHILLAVTPLYYVVIEGVIGAPAEIVEPARLGLIIMTPWTWSIAYRRFNQGVLIRFGHSRAVGFGTMIRLTADMIVSLTGYAIGSIPGVVVATGAMASGVISEAVYAGMRVRPVLRDQLKKAPPLEDPLTFPGFMAFYIPLVMTSLLTMLVQPIGSAALSRMPLALESLAVWQVVSGLVFLLRSGGVAYNEVVVTLLDDPQAPPGLRRFTAWLAASATAGLLLIVATPLATLWFARVSALAPPLAELARSALWLFLPIPALSALQSWYQGAILNSRRTRGITEAIVVFLLTASAILWIGVAWGRIAGLYVGGLAFSVGTSMQTIWLWLRSRPAMRAVQERDAEDARLQSVGAPAR
jgi:hypothetical protein